LREDEWLLGQRGVRPKQKERQKEAMSIHRSRLSHCEFFYGPKLRITLSGSSKMALNSVG
jgi:hypothetical protein